MQDRLLKQSQSKDAVEVSSPVLSLVSDCLRTFEQKAIRYCYWKRSARLSQAMNGDKDLDLLIARADQHRAAALLAKRGFKLFLSVSHRDHPAVSSYLGFDEPSGRLVHVHLHTGLVVGERLFKNYRLPWEDKLLARAVYHADWPVRILDPAAEAFLMMVRASLELSRWDPITLRRWTETREQYSADLSVLRASVPAIDVANLAIELLGGPVALTVMEAFESKNALQACAGLRAGLIASIGGYRLYGPIEARARSIGRSLLWAASSLNKHWVHAPRPWNRRSPGGGCVIAIVGLDGSGKSTAVATLQRWLMAEVDVMPIYFGTGEGRPSLVLLPFKLLVPLVEPFFKHKPSGSSHGTVTTHGPGPVYTVAMSIWATIVAAEKRLKLISARRAAGRGMVVIADRYPQNEILRFNDGPLLPRLSMAPGALRHFERTAYSRAQTMPPDLVLKLVVTPATAAKREPSMDRDVIAERVIQLRDLTFGGARVVPIDAEQPLEDVVRALKHEVWAAL